MTKRRKPANEKRVFATRKSAQAILDSTKVRGRVYEICGIEPGKKLRFVPATNPLTALGVYAANELGLTAEIERKAKLPGNVVARERDRIRQLEEAGDEASMAAAAELRRLIGEPHKATLQSEAQTEDASSDEDGEQEQNSGTPEPPSPPPPPE